MTVRIFDAELELRDGAAAAITTTTAGTAGGIDLDVSMDFKVALNVTVLDTADADETYVISAEVDTASGFASAVQVGTLTVTAVGSYEIPLSSKWVTNLEAAADFIRVVATLAGTTPSLTYGAFLVPA